MKIACLREIADSIDLEDMASRSGLFKIAEAIILERLKRFNDTPMF